MTLPACIAQGCGKPARFMLSDVAIALGMPTRFPHDGPICADCYDSIYEMLRNAEPPEEA